MFEGQAPVTIIKKMPIYDEIDKLLMVNNYDAIADKIFIKQKVEAASDGEFTIANGVLVCDEEALPTELSKTIMDFIELSEDFTPLVRFWRNIKLNPSENSKLSLYGYIAANHMTLTEDGCFIAYKAVDSDYLDSYTKTFDNSIGNTVSIDRSMVDSDVTKTCSHGLHVAAWDYAQNHYGKWGGSNRIVIEVSVNPKDVVAVPYDYNNQKMRVCEYTVLRDCGGQELTAIVDGSDNESGLDDVVESYNVAVVDGRINIPKSMLLNMGIESGTCIKAYKPYVDATTVYLSQRLSECTDENSKIYEVNEGTRLRIPVSMFSAKYADCDFEVELIESYDQKLFIKVTPLF